MNHVELFVDEKHKRRVAFLPKSLRRLGILRIDDPNSCARLQLLAIFDQLHQLVIAPRSPFAAHEKEYDGPARAQFFRKSMRLARIV